MNLNDIIKKIEPFDSDMFEKAKAHTANLAIPPRSLGRLHEISEKLSAIRRTLIPGLDKKVILVMAGDHGVAAEGVSAFPQEVTGEMVGNFLAGGASINALAREAGADVWVVDMGIIPEVDSQPAGGRWISRRIAPGTANMAQGPAMTAAQAEQAVVQGFTAAREAFTTGADIVALGDMGIANTTPSTAIAHVVTGLPLSDLVGRGTGLDNNGLSRKEDVIRRAIEINRPDPGEGLDVLAKVGGFEIGGLAGAALAGAYEQKPVVIDGLISTAGALIAHTLCPTVADYLFAGHCSQEPAHKGMLDHMGLKPILDLELRLGEGTGAALAISIIGSAARMFREVLTFNQAGVTTGDALPDF